LSTFKNTSTSDDLVFGSYEFIIWGIAGLLVGGDGGGDGDLGKLSPSSTDLGDDALH
jgi:hypothetical protein